MQGLKPPLYQWPEFPRAVLAEWMGAFHGGESRIGFIDPDMEPATIVPLDFRGGHVAAAALAEVDDLKKARRVTVSERDPAATMMYLERLARRVSRWLDRPGPTFPLSEEDWRRLTRTLVWVLPREDVLPHRTRRNARSAWRMSVAPLSSNEPLPFVLIAVLRAALEREGTVPTITRASRLIPVGRAGVLRDVVLPDGAAVRPTESLPMALASMRHRLQDKEDISPRGRARLGAWAKLAANAMVSGNPVQVNRRDLHGRRERMLVWEPDGRHRVIRSAVVEEPGAWYFPPIAAGVTATLQFLLFIARALVERRGSRAAYEAIDSLAVLASESGGSLVLERPDGTEADEP